MPEGALVSDALLKHAVRHSHWLPACKRRRERISEDRQLEYFTFVGTKPLDVLLLAVAHVLPHSRDTGYSAVKYFDRNGDDPSNTLKLIPGAQPFGGPFTRTMLVDEASPIEEPGQAAPGGSAERDEYELLVDTQAQFRGYFPFDVVNFDLEAVLFKPDEHPPGDLLRALTKLFRWQAEGFEERQVDAFSLMLSVPLASSALEDPVKELFRNVVEANLQRFPQFEAGLLARVNAESISSMEVDAWEEMFAIAMPKVILDALFASGWKLSETDSVELLRRERTGLTASPEVIYHLVLEVERNNAQSSDPKSLQSYEAVVQMLYESGPQRLGVNNVTAEVRTSLQQVVNRSEVIAPI